MVHNKKTSIRKEESPDYFVPKEETEPQYSKINQKRSLTNDELPSIVDKEKRRPTAYDQEETYYIKSNKPTQPAEPKYVQPKKAQKVSDNSDESPIMRPKHNSKQQSENNNSKILSAIELLCDDLSRKDLILLYQSIENRLVKKKPQFYEDDD